MSATLKVRKVLVLPSTLEPDCIYFVRTGTGYDALITDITGGIAHKMNEHKDTAAEVAKLSKRLNVKKLGLG